METEPLFAGLDITHFPSLASSGDPMDIDLPQLQSLRKHNTSSSHNTPRPRRTTARLDKDTHNEKKRQEGKIAQQRYRQRQRSQLDTLKYKVEMLKQEKLELAQQLIKLEKQTIQREEKVDLMRSFISSMFGMAFSAQSPISLNNTNTNDMAIENDPRKIKPRSVEVF
mmetsp:Transcript_3330/g.3677  ORF Transcript_3330/g.3677 Transcript_3330/m.3677 type:complete len:168 (+) Transcript_3330:47-550(+)